LIGYVVKHVKLHLSKRKHL